MNAGSASSPRWKKWALNFVGLAVSAGCLWWAAGPMVDTAEKRTKIIEVFQQANYWLIIPLWGALFAFYWLKAWRWRLLLKPLGDYRPIKDLFPPTLIGFAFNNLLPAHLGEFVRTVVMGRRFRLPMTAVFSSLVLERVFDIFAIVTFLGCGLLFVKNVDPSIKKYALIGSAGAAALVIGAFIFVLWTKPFVRLFEAVLSRVPLLPKGLVTKLAGLLESAASGLTSLHQPKLLAGIFASSLAQWALNGWMMWVALAAFNVHVSPWVACILLGAVAFGVTVPSTPGYFGVIQALFILVLKFFVPEQEQAVFAASIFYHLGQYVPVTLLGLYYFNRTGLKVSEIQKAAEVPPAKGLPAASEPAG